MERRTYPFNLGEYQCNVLYDYAHAHTVEELIVNPSHEELEAMAPEFHLPLPEIPVGYNNLLLRKGGRNILIDAGIQRPLGELSLGLDQLDVSPNEIDTIVITHSDRDHVGGIVDQEGKISFPNARYVMLKELWDHWSSEERRMELTRLNQWTEEKTQFIWEIFSKVQGSIQYVESGEEFRPGMKLISAPGHRYDHSIVVLTSSGERLVHLADAVVHPLFIAKSEWYSTYDADPAQAVETKKKILGMCASWNALVFASHFPFPGLGTVQQERDHWRWQSIGNS